MSAELPSGDVLLQRTRIDLSFQGLHDGNVDGLADVVRNSAVLRELNLYSNRLALTAPPSNDEEDGSVATNALVDAIAASKTLEVLSLGSNMIAEAGGRNLAAAVKDHATLREIHLGGNRVGNGGAVALGEALSANASVEMISLYENGIGDEGAKALADAIRVNPSLKVAWLHGNMITDAGGLALADALEKNLEMGLLFLLGNKLGPDLGKRIDVLLKDPKRKNKEYAALSMTAGAAKPPAASSSSPEKAPTPADVVGLITHFVDETSQQVTELLTPRTCRTPAAMPVGERKGVVVPAMPSSQPATPRVSSPTKKAAAASAVRPEVASALEEAVAALKEELAAKDVALAARDARIAELEEEGEKRGGVDALEAEVKALTDVIENSARKLIPSALAAKDSTISSLNAKISEMTVLLADHGKAAQESTAKIAELESEVSSVDEAHSASLAEARAAAAEKESARAALEEAMEALNETIAQKVAKIATNDSALSRARDEIEVQKRALAERDEEAAQKDAEVEALREECAAKDAAMDATVASMDEVVASKQREIDAFGDPLLLLQAYLARKDDRIKELEAELSKSSSSQIEDRGDVEVACSSAQGAEPSEINDASSEEGSTISKDVSAKVVNLDAPADVEAAAEELLSPEMDVRDDPEVINV